MNKDTKPISEQELIDRARSSLSDHALPEDVQRRLRMARAEAVAQMGDDVPFLTRAFGGHRWVLPAGAAAILVLAVSLTGTDETYVMPMLDEQELAAASEMELLDDIEFLAWMLEEHASPGVPDDS